MSLPKIGPAHVPDICQQGLRLGFYAENSAEDTTLKTVVEHIPGFPLDGI